MSRINKWYSNSKNKLENEVWPKLGPEGTKSIVKQEPKLEEQVVQTTSSLNQNEYPKLGETTRIHDAGKSGKSKEIRQYYDSVNVMQKSRSRKVKSQDPITLNLQHIINNSAASINNKSKILSKKVSRSDPHVKCKRRIKHGKIKLPSSLKKYILWERELKRNSTKEVSALEIGKLKIEDEIETKTQNDMIKNLSNLNLLGQDYRDTVLVAMSDDTLETRSDLIGQLEKLKVGPNSIKRLECLEESFNRMSTKENTLDTDALEKSLSLKENDEEKIRFSRKFREYCTNLVTPGLTLSLDNFLTEIKRLQRKSYERDDVKGRIRKRFYAGFKEVEKYIYVNKIKFVVIATDIDKIIENGILDKTVEKFTETCKKHEVPICYGLVRHKLGYFVYGKGIVSVIGIVNYNGLEELFERVLKELIEARNAFNQNINHLDKVVELKNVPEINNFLISRRISSLLKVISSTQ